MKKILFLALMLAGCTTYHQTISSYNKIDFNAKTVAVSSANMTDIYQEFKQILNESGFKIYNKDNGGYMARYELSDDIQKDDNVRCGLWETGYTYDIVLKDTLRKGEVFGMQGQGCRENILKDFTALINNRYGEKKNKVDEPKDEDAIQAPALRSDGVTWWGN
ncbi:MAG: hypothetical protein J6W96_01840 [Alphaproteobacteria bacterium]|nr:hypothetical protein [Alphaproteobacteria bacterium]